MKKTVKKAADLAAKMRSFFPSWLDEAYSRDAAFINDKILAKGEIDTVTGAKFNLTEAAEKSAEAAVLGRIDSITNNSSLDGNGSSDIIIHNCHIEEIGVFATNRSVCNSHGNFALELIYNSFVNEDISGSTFVHVATKKHVPNMGYNSDSSVISEIGSHSNLPLIYSKLAKRWSQMLENGAKDNNTYVLYIPNILFYISDKKGSVIMDNPSKLNLLLVIVPNAKQLTDEGEKINHLHAIKSMISDACKAIAFLGCRTVRIDPFADSYFKKHPAETIDAWGEYTAYTVYGNTVAQTDFYIPDTDEFISLHAKVKGSVGNF